jgi:ATP adenylyltransferase
MWELKLTAWHAIFVQSLDNGMGRSDAHWPGMQSTGGRLILRSAELTSMALANDRRGVPAMNTCRLCCADSTEPWNVPLIESPNFMVFPSLGALVEGWVLLVPKQHFLSIGALPDSLISEMQQLKETVCRQLQQNYGTVSAFEHGPGQKQRKVGCGVDHAHLHILPADFDLSGAVSPYLPAGARWSAANLAECRAAVNHGEDYLYLEQPIGNVRIVRHQDLGSQLFRRAIAAHLGAPDEFDWRDNPQMENVKQTIQSFSLGTRRGSSILNASEHAA